MEEEDFLDNDMSASARRFEEMFEAGGEIYMDSEELEDLSEYYMNRRDFRMALRVIQSGIDKFPFESVFKLLKAEVLFTTANFRPALEILDDILLYEPLNTEALQIKADVLMSLGYYSEAKACLQTCLPFAEDTAAVKASLYRCLLLSEQEDENESLNFAKQIFDTDAREHELIFNEFTFLFSNPELEGKSMVFYEWYTNEYPEKAAGWMGLARAASNMGDHLKCITACDYATVLDREESAAYFLRAQSCIELNNFEQAIEDLLAVIERDGEDDFLYCRLAACYLEQEELAEARKAYRKALKIDAESHEAWYGLSLCYKQEDKFKEALHYINKAISLEPDMPDYQMDKAEILIGMGQFEDALEIYQLLTEESPADEEVWLNMATVYAETDHYAEALGCLYEALEYCPETAAICYRLASYHFIMGDSLEGIEYLEKALGQKFDDHFLLFLHAPELQNVGTIWEIIDVYRNENSQT